MSDIFFGWIAVFVGVFAFIVGASFLAAFYTYRRLRRYF